MSHRVNSTSRPGARCALVTPNAELTDDEERATGARMETCGRSRSSSFGRAPEQTLRAKSVIIDPFTPHIHIVGRKPPSKELQDPVSDTVSQCERCIGRDTSTARSIPPTSESWPDSGERTGDTQQPPSCGLRQGNVNRLMGSGLKNRWSGNRDDPLRCVPELHDVERESLNGMLAIIAQGEPRRLAGRT